MKEKSEEVRGGLGVGGKLGADLAREGSLACTRWAKDNVESFLVLLEEVVMGQETACCLILLCDMRVIFVMLTDEVHCSLLEVPQKLHSILLFVLGWMTFRNLQSDIVHMWIIPSDRHVRVSIYNRLKVLLSQMATIGKLLQRRTERAQEHTNIMYNTISMNACI